MAESIGAHRRPLLPELAAGSDPAPDGLLDAVAAYERALMTNDLSEMDRLFAPGPATMRGDAAGLLVGHGAIGAFRGGRGGAPLRTVRELHVRRLDDNHALVVAVTAPRSGGRGQQTQLWRRGSVGWVVDVAHVSVPAPVVDASVWRVVGAPLVAPTGTGGLDGVRVAVKDLVAIAGQVIGAGVPEWLDEAAPEPVHAPAVAALLAAGASVQGIARTDELAYSLAGRNPHYGTPPNVAVRGALPGGSSSGPAAAVALGQADLGLATDTAGSIRVPASYQGLWGLRTTHGVVSTVGVLPLSPSFDTVGWLAREPQTLRAAAVATLGVTSVPLGGVVVDLAVLGLVEPALAAAVRALADRLDAEPVDVTGAIGGLDVLADRFRTVQAAEAWRHHGAWVTAHPGALGAEIGARFAWAATVTAEQEAAARAELAATRDALAAVLGDRVLLVPSAASGAPAASAGGPEIERIRTVTLTLTCLAGVLGAPALSVPGLKVGGAPIGVCLIGPRGSDVALIDRALDSAVLTASWAL